MHDAHPMKQGSVTVLFSSRANILFFFFSSESLEFTTISASLCRTDQNFLLIFLCSSVVFLLFGSLFLAWIRLTAFADDDLF